MAGDRFTDAEWQAIAERQLSQWEGHKAAARDYVSAQSRWMVAQLFVANSGALLALAGSDALRPSLAASGPFFVSGVVLSILCGLATWWHAGLVVEAMDRLTDAALPFDRARWPQPGGPSRLEVLALRSALGAGVASLIAFAAGAFMVAA